MLVFPNCKINLGLRVLYKRPDGYHALETVFYPVRVEDSLEVINRAVGSQQPGTADWKLTIYGMEVQGAAEDNLCIKALHLLKKHFPGLPAVEVHLLKKIPIGAGLGGGSSNGAFMLRLLNEKYQLGLSQSQLIEYALQLGSDCPFFILNQPCHATGRGEIMEPIALSLAQYQLLIVNPGIHINTGWAFSQLQRSGAMPGEPAVLPAIVRGPITTWKDTLVNDFEKPVFEAHPEIKAIRDSLYAQGALYASLSGSGSTVFGFFEKNRPPALKFPSHYTVVNL